MTGRTAAKQYLGDAVYIEFDGFAIVLTTEDGVSITNQIVLEPEVLDAFMNYVDQLRPWGPQP